MKYKYLVFTFIVLFLLLFSFDGVQASTLFADDFSGSSPEKWIATNNANWHIENGQYGLNNFGQVTNSVPSDLYWNYDWENISYEVDVRSVSGFDKNVLVKFVDTSNFIEIHHSVHQLFLVKYSTLGGTQILDSMSLGNDHQVVYKYRTEIQGNNIKVYLNGALIFDALEPLPLFENWKIGMRMGNAEVWYDNVVVTDLGEDLPSLDVPVIKQYSPPWNDDIYDKAEKWSTNPTIERWGCALTSAAMVLGYHGFNIDPGALNQWLRSQKDGYLGNGLVNWLAISRYTKQNPIAGIDALEFRSHPFSAEGLTEELTEGRPPILKEVDHFVVGKSKTTDSFGIIDPFYDDRPTLASYSNSASRIYSYIPSMTNLSYILLTLEPGFEIRVEHPEDGEILGSYWIEEPLADDMEGVENSGTPIGVFMYKEPTDGIYKVTINGEGVYHLNSYLYDENGNVVQQVFEGIAGSSPDEYQILIGGNSLTSFGIDNILNDIDELYLVGKFKNEGVYTSLKTQALKVKNFLEKGDVFNAKVILDVLSIQLSEINNKVLESEESQALQNEISLFSGSL